MMKETEDISLFLNTASKNLALEVRTKESYYRVDLGDPKKSLERTHLGIEMALSALGLKSQDIRSYYCLLGPGSNTGIRLGLTIPRTLYAFDPTIRLFGLGTLELMLLEDRKAIAALSDRNGNLFLGSYDSAGKLVERKVDKKDFAGLEDCRYLVEKQDTKALEALKGKKADAFDMLDLMVSHADRFEDFSKREKDYLPHYAFKI